MRCCCRIRWSCVADPYAVLREADRVLVAEGQLIVLGFRPASLWGLRAAASRGRLPAGPAPHSVRLAGARLARAAQLRDRQLRGPICTACRARLRGSIEAAMPSMLHRGWFYPWPAAAYLIKARKRVYTLTPIRPRLRERRTVFGGLAEPSA